MTNDHPVRRLPHLYRSYSVTNDAGLTIKVGDKVVFKRYGIECSGQVDDLFTGKLISVRRLTGEMKDHCVLLAPNSITRML
jgi:hypothetical protein